MAADSGKIEMHSVGRAGNRRKGVVGVSDLSAGRTRRNFLRGVLYTAGGVLALKFLDKGDGQQVEAVNGGVKVEPIAKYKVADIGPVENKSATNIINKAYPNSSVFELAGKIRETEEEMGSKLKEEELSRADSYKLAIKNAVNSSNLPSEIEDLLFGLIIQESSGKQYAVSQNSEGRIIAKGPVQITEEMAIAHNLKTSDDRGDERFDKDVSLKVAVGEIGQAYNYWNDLGMAIWEWHTGRSQLQYIVDLHLRDNYPGEAQSNSSTYPAKLKQHRLDAHKILSNKVLQAKLNDPKYDWDSTSKFLYRIVAGTLAYKRRAETVQAATLR